jgi:hypothetical protein
MSMDGEDEEDEDDDEEVLVPIELIRVSTRRLRFMLSGYLASHLAALPAVLWRAALLAACSARACRRHLSSSPRHRAPPPPHAT